MPAINAPLWRERIATFPSYGHWPNGLVEYSICDGTFTELGANANWPSLIEYAFERWEEDVPDMLTMTRTTDGCVDDDGDPITNDDPSTLFKALYNDTNEVYMYRFSLAHLPEIYWHNSDFVCIRLSGACVLSTRYDEYFAYGAEPLEDDRTDVIVNRDISSGIDKVPGGNFTHDATDVRLNRCLEPGGVPDLTASEDKNQDGDNDDYFSYTLMLHEAGHLVGLSQYHRLFPIDLDGSDAHPSVRGTVMNYDGRVNAMLEPDCSLHPLDKLAVRALYQNVRR